MSKIGQWMMRLSERPEFVTGYNACKEGKKEDESGLEGEAAQAWFLGWQHARWEDTPDSPGDDESEQPS